MEVTEFVSDLRSRINPAYAATLGTESYERRLCAEAIEGLLSKLAEAEKDAARYRWLRNEGVWLNPMHTIKAGTILDNIADAAMKEQSHDHA